MGFRSLAGRRDAEDVHRQDSVLQELRYRIQLLRILVRGRQRRVRSRKSVGMHFSVYVAEIGRIQQRHVAIHATCAFRRIVEGASAHAGDATGLPRVVVIETAHPSIAVDVRIQMHFVA